MKFFMVLAILNLFLVKHIQSIVCQVCDSSKDANCGDDFVSRVVRCPANSRFCVTKIFNWYSQNSKLYTRDCANFCYSGTVIQPGYSLTTKCCQDDNCNARCQSDDCSSAHKFQLTKFIYFLSSFLCLLNLNLLFQF